MSELRQVRPLDPQSDGTDLGSQVCVRNSGLREAGLEHDSQSYLDDHEIYVARLYVDEICTRASSPVIVNRLPKQHRQGIIANSQTP